MAVSKHIPIIKLKALHRKRQNLFQELDGVIMMFFFFQAEDGIRDYKVTGVQTCALPILPELHGDVPKSGSVMFPHSDVKVPKLAQRLLRVYKTIIAEGRFFGMDDHFRMRSEEHTSELQSPCNLVCRLLLEKKKNTLDISHLQRLLDALARVCEFAHPIEQTAVIDAKHAVLAYAWRLAIADVVTLRCWRRDI